MNYNLTIAIPTYNRSYILESNLEKIFEFIGEDTEVLVSDNGSIDDTQEKCRKFECHANFTYIRNSINEGYDLNVLACARHAQGEYIWFLSDDDLISFRLYERVLFLIKTNIYTGILVNGKVVERFSEKEIVESLSSIKNNCTIIGDDKSISDHFKWSTLLSSQILKKDKIDYDNAQKFVGTVFIQLGMFWMACKNEKVYLLCDHYLKKYDSTTNDFGKTTAYIWLWNLLDASQLLNESGYSYKAVKQAQSSIFKSGVLSQSGVVAHYVLSRLEDEGPKGLGNLKKVLRFVNVTIFEFLVLSTLAVLPNLILKKIAQLAKFILK